MFMIDKSYKESKLNFLLLVGLIGHAYICLTKCLVSTAPDGIAQYLSMTNRLFSRNKQRADVCSAPSSKKQTPTIKKTRMRQKGISQPR